MTYQIDQSGKIEDTAKNTILAYSNEIQKSILISRKTKRKIQEVFRLCGYSKLYIYYLFAVGIYHLLIDFSTQKSITIDIEYPGKDKIILQLIEKLLKAYNKPAHNIKFSRIGNHPKVHYAAYNVFSGKKKADCILRYKELLQSIKKTDGRLRECLSTLVGVQSRSARRIPKKIVVVNPVRKGKDSNGANKKKV